MADSRKTKKRQPIDKLRRVVHKLTDSFVSSSLDKLEQNEQNFALLFCICWLKMRYSWIALILKNSGLRITGTGSSCGACTLMIYTIECRSTGTGCGAAATGVSASLGSHYVDQENVYTKFFLVICILTISNFICQTLHALFLHSFCAFNY